jgi:hypothetical protein
MSSGSTKPTKVAILTFGPESAGNRMFVRSLDTAGVASVYSKNGEYISGPHEPTFADNPFVHCMSMPYNLMWPDIVQIYRKTQAAGYDKIHLVFFDRETDFMANSQVVQGRIRFKHADIQTKEDALKVAKHNIELARRYLDGAAYLLHFEGVRPIRVQYEDFVTNTEYRKDIFALMGLPEPTLEYFNANEKGI